ncbi:MAG: agmatinase [Thermoplasmata archaeon]|nr:agmatinase [Thermoplasmata archaeon]MCI4359996.1 agmatinase [Thermoplasmata archaeon]
MERPNGFADAHATFEAAQFVVAGIPFDRTTSFRPGARFGPDSIRQHSWNFESYDLETGVDLAEVPIHDLGNTAEFGNAQDMVTSVRAELRPVYEAGKIPIILGGDHACSPPCVEAYPDGGSIGVLYIDAHLDFRSSYLGDSRSHACSSRRIVEKVGAHNVVVLGVRSVSREEVEDNRSIGMAFVTAQEVFREGIESAMQKALNMLRTDRIYLSLDIDAIDPAFAGGTGTPEPFGLTPRDVKHAIGMVAPRLAGMDIMEVSPHYDQGNTSALAARLAREAIVRAVATHRVR